MYLIRAAGLTLAAGILVSWGAQQPGYIGAQACGECHPAQFAAQSKSGHAGALRPAAAHPLAASFAPHGGLRREPDYRFRFRREGAEIRVRADSASGAVDIPVEWAFGAGSQAVTFVSRLSAEWYLEHYFSYYPRAGRMGPTPGQSGLAARTIQLAMGLTYPATDPKTGMLGCFECHSTGPVTGGAALRPAEPGVRCEACHGPGKAHRTGDRRAIRGLRSLSGPEMNKICGTCHRPPASAPESINWNEAWNVRHQPLYLDRSACFRESRGALSCVTCHSPHEPLRQDAAYYNSKCAGCHRPQPSAECREECVSCHMPAVSPQAYLRFTNHWIGVYRGGASLTPRR